MGPVKNILIGRVMARTSIEKIDCEWRFCKQLDTYKLIKTMSSECNRDCFEAPVFGSPERPGGQIRWRFYEWRPVIKRGNVIESRFLWRTTRHASHRACMHTRTPTPPSPRLWIVSAKFWNCGEWKGNEKGWFGGSLRNLYHHASCEGALLALSLGHTRFSLLTANSWTKVLTAGWLITTQLS